MHNVILWSSIAFIPFIWFFQNVVHESSHALIPLLKGCETKIYPWPKYMNGRWYMAYSTWQCHEVFPQHLRLLISAAPRIVDLLIIAVTTIIQPSNQWANTILQAWQIAAFVDFSFNTMGSFYGPDRNNDAWTCAQLSGWDAKVGWFRFWSVIATTAALAPVLFRFFG